MVRLKLFLTLCISAQASIASPIYHSTDEYGRNIYSDAPPHQPHKIINIEQANDYDWHQFKYAPPRLRKNKRKKKRHKKSVKKLSFDQLRAKCQAARYKHQNYRGRGGNDNWGKYKAKVIKYAERRDYWCSRYLKRK